MKPLVERLRWTATRTTQHVGNRNAVLMLEAADEIERLQAAAAKRDECEHCGAALMPRKGPILCESCVAVCSDSCGHRWRDQDFHQ
jgi:hypothetical protein